jgi:hypothetical protein
MHVAYDAFTRPAPSFARPFSDPAEGVGHEA